MSSLGPTRASEPLRAVSDDHAYDSSWHLTILVVDLLEGDWLATLEGFLYHPSLGKGGQERPGDVGKATPLQHGGHKISKESCAQGEQSCRGEQHNLKPGVAQLS